MSEEKTQTVYIEVPVSERLPDESEDILISYDGGITYPESAAFREHRKCMLAGVGGGNGYFGSGFCSNGSTGCDNGLILSDITHWLEKKEDQILLSREELNKLLSDAFDVGYGATHFSQKELYLTNLIK